jgi:DNA-binding MarR family transcriptional regulator
MLSTALSETRHRYEEYINHQHFDSPDDADLEDFLKDRPTVATSANLIEDIVMKYGRISVSRISKALRLKKDIVLFYIETLEENGLVRRKTSLIDDYITATEKLIAIRRKDLVSYIEKHIDHFPAKKIKSHLHKFGWEMPLLDIILKNNADYIPVSLSRMKKELAEA